MPSAVSNGRDKQIPVSQQICICNLKQVENVIRYAPKCPLYDSPREKLRNILSSLTTHPDQKIMCFLFGVVYPFVTYRTTLYALAASKHLTERTSVLKEAMP